jgi:hypothetical protein
LHNLQDEIGDEPNEYFVVPEEAFEQLPPEWRDQLQAIAEDGRAVLRSVDKELSALSRLSTSLVTLVSLKHVQDRLSAFRFAATTEAILDLDMLTTAFVVTYARLHQGGGGSGFSRDVLPGPLRPIHDEIIELRNKRFAHQAGHHSVTDAMEVGLDDEGFKLKLGLEVGFHVGGRREWPELVNFIDAMMAERLEKLQARLTEKTGRPWAFPKGPAD